MNFYYLHDLYLVQAVLERVPIKTLQLVLTHVQVNHLVAVPDVEVVGQLFYLIGPEVQPEHRPRHKSVVEPHKLVVRHVQPLQVIVGRQQPVDVFQLILVQSQGLQ